MSRRGATRLPYYEALGVEATATQEEIRRAYRKLAMRWHPDKNPDNVAEAEAQFKFIAEAFETLGDELRRADYDRGGAAPPRSDFGDAPSGGAYGDPRQRYGGGGGFYAHAVDPFEIFNAFFGGGRGADPFATFMDDDFFAPQPRFHQSDPFFGGGGGGGFAGGFGGAHLPSLHAQLLQQQAAMQQQQQRQASGGYGGGGMGGGFASVSTSSTTTVVNGVRTTRTTTTRRHADGRVETQTEERSEPVQPAGRAAAAARLDGAYGGGWGAPAPSRSSWGAAEAVAPAQPRQQQQRPPEPRGSIASYFRRANASM